MAFGRREGFWREHCHSMAEAAYALAEQSNDCAMMELHIALAARWVLLADGPRPEAQKRGRRRDR